MHFRSIGAAALLLNDEDLVRIYCRQIKCVLLCYKATTPMKLSCVFVNSLLHKLVKVRSLMCLAGEYFFVPYQ